MLSIWNLHVGARYDVENRKISTCEEGLAGICS